ncbi:MAG: hypothetical protein ACRC8K_07500 [Waterburya sp.]
MNKQQLRYLATTDFDLIRGCMEWKLTPKQFRILHYINSCVAHDIKEVNLGETADWLEMEFIELYLNIQALQAKGALSGVSFYSLKVEEEKA